MGPLCGWQSKGHFAGIAQRNHFLALPDLLGKVLGLGEVHVAVGLVEVARKELHIGAQVDDAVEAVGGEGFDQCRVIGEILAQEGEALLAQFGERFEAGFFQADVVIVVDDIDADDAVAAREEADGEAVADEAGGAGDENLHAYPRYLGPVAGGTGAGLAGGD